MAEQLPKPTHYRVFGRLFKLTAVFATDEEANRHMETHPQDAVIAVCGGWVMLADKDDRGTVMPKGETIYVG